MSGQTEPRVTVLSESEAGRLVLKEDSTGTGVVWLVREWSSVLDFGTNKLIPLPGSVISLSPAEAEALRKALSGDHIPPDAKEST